MTRDSLGFFHSTCAGRFLLGVLSVALVAVLLGWNIPDPDVRETAHDRLRPVVNALVINQGWGVFAPNPTRTSARVYAEVTFDDGSTTVYDFPDSGVFIGALREYHWRKLERRLRQDDNSSLWRPTAMWIADELTAGGRTVIEVDLMRRQARTPDAGSGDPLVWKIERFHTFSRAPSDIGPSDG